MSPAKNNKVLNTPYKRRWRAARRARGLGYINREGMSLESYAKVCEWHNAQGRTPRGLELHTARVRRYRAKMKELYGGRPDDNIHARVKWLEAKNANHITQQ